MTHISEELLRAIRYAIETVPGCEIRITSDKLRGLYLEVDANIHVGLDRYHDGRRFLLGLDNDLPTAIRKESDKLDKCARRIATESRP